MNKTERAKGRVAKSVYAESSHHHPSPSARYAFRELVGALARSRSPYDDRDVDKAPERIRGPSLLLLWVGG